ncbi:unnamed protein product [Acanthoscelides obtectus]|nr:unnamed protein product [Acanthoscelides obtectus]CAK1677038.1 Cytoplasmic tRNA 2-thiolation protein 2-A [Acanthoscelides obtectus]
MVRDGLNLNTPKKLNFCPVIVFIEDLYHLTIEERHNVIEQANKVIGEFHFDLFLVSLAQYAGNTGSIDKLICQASEVLPISENDEHELFRNVQPNTSVTNKKELISILKRNLLIEVAKHLDCKFIFTNEISQDIAINLLTNVSLACGNRIPIEAGFCDDIDSQVKILRPLYLFDSKEIEFYTKYNNINYTHSRNEETNPYSSIQTLLEKFVVDLQANFPATINTILKIGDKLDIVKGDISCQLCKIPICEQSSQLTSEESTRFSSLVSTSKIDLADPDLSNKFAPINGKAYCFSCDELSKCLLKR